MPLSGLRIAAERAAADRLPGACWAVAADGAGLPFRSGSFDAVSHSDVLCCLEAKLAVVQDCRRIIRAGGRMVFTVISVAPGLAAADHNQAVEFGPPFVAARDGYPAMLQQAGWTILEQTDVTAEYAKSVGAQLGAEETHADALSELMGAADFSERLTRRRGTVRAAEKGLLRRELFAATAAG